MMKNLHVIIWFVLFPALLYAHEDKPTPVKPKQSYSQNMVGVSSSMQLQLDNALLKLEQQLGQNHMESQIFDAMDNLPLMVTAEAENDRSTAENLMKYLDDNPDKLRNLSSLNFESLTTLGLRRVS